MNDSGSGSPWYAEGLRFSCTRCGNCCGGAPGHVWVSLEETEAIAADLGLAAAAFTKRHVRRVGTRLSLLEKRGGDCEFLLRPKPGVTGCSIHRVRPVQCQTWPFWASNLESATAWDLAARQCPGMNHGRLHGLRAIQAALRKNGDLPL